MRIMIKGGVWKNTEVRLQTDVLTTSAGAVGWQEPMQIRATSLGLVGARNGAAGLQLSA